MELHLRVRATATIADNHITGTGVDVNPNTASDGIVANVLSGNGSLAYAPVLTIQGNVITASNAGMNPALPGDRQPHRRDRRRRREHGQRHGPRRRRWRRRHPRHLGQRPGQRCRQPGHRESRRQRHRVVLSTGPTSSASPAVLSRQPIPPPSRAAATAPASSFPTTTTYFGEGEAGGSTAALSGNTVTGFATGVEVQSVNGTSVSATIGGSDSGDSNTITGAATGILVSGANASATISGNTGSIYGNAIGIDVEGGSATISGNHIYDNTTGVKFGTAAPARISGNNFAGATANGTDLLVAGGPHDFAVTSNTFAGTTYINNESTQPIDATTDTFGSVTPSDNTPADLYGVENQITDYLDNPSLGYVSLRTRRRLRHPSQRIGHRRRHPARRQRGPLRRDRVRPGRHL